MKEIIKKYLESLAKTDKALAKAYSEDKLDGCVRYINEQARKLLKNQSGYVDDPTVYGWARHFILDGDTTPEDIKAREEADAIMDERNAKEAKADAEENPAEPAPRKKHLGEFEQLDLFAGV